SVPNEEAVLIFSFVGFLTEERTVGNQNTIDVSLAPDIKKLNDVVVIGYGEIRKKDLSTAVSSLDYIGEMKSQPADINQMLQGTIAGVDVHYNGGDPGATPSIVIRGLGNPDDAPLWVVDGVPGAPVNTEDIESVTVLKDAASAAIYGASVGSGGVIMVTTKKGRTGKPKFEANMYSGFQNPWRLPKALNALQFDNVKNLAADNAGVSRNPVFDPAQNQWGAVTRTNWIDEIFRTGKTDHYAFSVTGGTDAIKAFASFEMNNTQGVLLNTYKKGFGGKINIDFNLSKNIHFSQWLQVGTSRGYSADTYSGYTGVIISAIYMPPSATVYDANGNFGGVVPTDMIQNAGSYGDIVNPVATLLRKDVYNPNTWVHSTSALDIRLFQGLTFKSAFTLGGYQNLYEDFNPKRPEPGKPNDQNSRTLDVTSGYHWLWENTATYARTFGSHNVNLIAGYSAQYKKSLGFGLTAYGFDNEASWARNLINSTDWSTTKPWENGPIEEAFDSWFSRFSYIYADRYFFTASLRHDATSKLYKDNNSGTFPAVSGAWKVSSESFFSKGFVSLFKLRGSWGQIGDVNSVPSYSYNVLLSSANQTVLGAPATISNGLGVSGIPNLSLTWETSEQTDFGLDMDMFGGKINIIADYYIKYTKNLIDRIPTPSTAGIGDNYPWGNIGKVRNRGFEFSVNYNGKLKDFSYKIGVNFATLHNEVMDLGSRDIYYYNDVNFRGVLTPFVSAVGQPWHSFYLIKTDGIFKTDQEAIGYVDKNGNRIQPNAKAGDLKFVDNNGDGIINDNDRVFMGSNTPKFTYGIQAHMDYKIFDLSFLFQGINGAKIFNAFKSTTLTASEQGYNMSADILGAWSTSNQGSNIPIISATDPNKNFQTNSDWFLEDGSYIRLKNVTLGVNVPQSFLKKISLSNVHLRVYASGENLLTFTKYKGMDPEVANWGLDVGTYPISRVFSFGLNLDF
ncbi:MAG TPA: SusC/RagA family TonB-linked outer membrane protein, partial [Bacteroidales bacterium]